MARVRRVPIADAEPDVELLDTVRSLSLPLDGMESLDPLIERIGDARFVLLGEATHGTAEFYTWRRMISERLIREKEFSFIAVEGDWPDCYRVNRYVKGYANAGQSARVVLHAFGRWPTWMWANEEVVALAEWLRSYNQALPEDRKVGFYGLDVYSLWESLAAILEYLKKTDGAAAAAARRAFACFEPFEYDVDEYARATAWIPTSCEDEVIDMLRALREHAPRYERDGGEEYFNAKQNALVTKNAEKYYRTMVRGDSPSWNIRDRHMTETLERLMTHHGPRAKAIVWEHNTHVGDARYTDMAASGMVNVGQLVRQGQQFGDVVLIGFSTHHGSVIAGEAWGAAVQRMSLPPARPGSWEDVLHHAAPDKQLIVFRPDGTSNVMLAPRGHRAIGVVYRPQYEAFGNYVPTIMPLRYDALIYLDKTHALHPLHVPASFEHEVPETFPSGV
jgi:erythromycin esterase-like protein